MTFDVWRSHSNKSEIIITAGVDGDEYAGIEAARQLIKFFSTTVPTIPLTIIPLVNRAGNNQGLDYNPLDGLFPKHIYPGFPLGTSSSRLMWKLSRIVRGHKLWLDLHGGNREEHLHPFVWADRTGTPTDHLTTHLLSNLSATTLYSQAPSLAPARYLSKRGTSYLVFESGELGQQKPFMVNQHLSWVKQAIKAYQAYQPQRHYSFSPTYTHLSHIPHQLSGEKPTSLLWYGPTYYYLGN